jgi:hypothetical protein
MLLKVDVTMHTPCNKSLDFFISLIGPCVPGEKSGSSPLFGEI